MCIKTIKFNQEDPVVKKSINYYTKLKVGMTCSVIKSFDFLVRLFNILTELDELELLTLLQLQVPESYFKF